MNKRFEIARTFDNKHKANACSNHLILSHYMKPKNIQVCIENNLNYTYCLITNGNLPDFTVATDITTVSTRSASTENVC